MKLDFWYRSFWKTHLVSHDKVEHRSNMKLAWTLFIKTFLEVFLSKEGAWTTATWYRSKIPRLGYSSGDGVEGCVTFYSCEKLNIWRDKRQKISLFVWTTFVNCFLKNTPEQQKFKNRNTTMKTEFPSTILIINSTFALTFNQI